MFYRELQRYHVLNTYTCTMLHYQVIARLATAVARGDTSGARSSNAGSAAAAEALKGLDLSTLDEIHIPEAEWQSVFKLLKDLETGVRLPGKCMLYTLYSTSNTERRALLLQMPIIVTALPSMTFNCASSMHCHTMQCLTRCNCAVIVMHCAGQAAAIAEEEDNNSDNSSNNSSDDGNDDANSYDEFSEGEGEEPKVQVDEVNQILLKYLTQRLSFSEADARNALLSTGI
jgi:hypothetical protein